MAGGNQPYVVRAGDYLTAIATRRGLTPDSVWNDPANADLRKLRKNPEMLAPGDILQLPPAKRKWLPVSVGSTNKFVATPPTVSIKLTLYQDDEGKNALSGMKFSIDGASGGQTAGTLGDDGVVEFEVAVSTRQVSLTIEDLAMRYPIVVGGIDPVEVSSGVAQRLTHLGYLDGPQATPPSAGALRAFQADAQITVTGVCDAATAKALVDKHGS